MADRGATTAFKDEIVKDSITPFNLVKIDLDGDITRMTDRVSKVTFDDGTGSADWLPTGHLLGISPIIEGLGAQINRLTLTIAGPDQTYFAIFLNNDYIDRPVDIWKGFLDSAGALIVDPILVFKGRIDKPIITEDPEAGTSQLTLSLANHWVDFERRTGRHTNDAEQQTWFPGDRGFEFVQEFVNRTITWGSHHVKIPFS